MQLVARSQLGPHSLGLEQRPHRTDTDIAERGLAAGVVAQDHTAPTRLGVEGHVRREARRRATMIGDTCTQNVWILI